MQALRSKAIESLVLALNVKIRTLNAYKVTNRSRNTKSKVCYVRAGINFDLEIHKIPVTHWRLTK